MKIYTKKGDKGTTDLIGERTTKYSKRIEAIGTMDEVNSFIQVAVANIDDQEVKDLLNYISQQLFDVGHDLALKVNREFKIKEKDVLFFEEKIDYFTSKLEPLNKFILPGGKDGSSYVHVIRSVSRRAERRLVELAQEEQINEVLLQYYNRLSDLMFTLGRYLNEK